MGYIVILRYVSMIFDNENILKLFSHIGIALPSPVSAHMGRNPKDGEKPEILEVRSNAHRT